MTVTAVGWFFPDWCSSFETGSTTKANVSGMTIGSQRGSNQSEVSSDAVIFFHPTSAKRSQRVTPFKKFHLDKGHKLER